MNVEQRRGIAVLALKVGFCSWRLMMSLIIPTVRMVVNLLAFLTRKKIRFKIKTLTTAVARHTERTASFCAECLAMTQAGERLTGAMLATQSALVAESNRMLEVASELRATKILGAPVVSYVVTSMQGSVFRRQQKTKAFLKILSQIESPTFYAELLLWFIIPQSYSEELLGDLAEEYRLRNVADGEASARDWYGRHIRSTIKDHLWNTFERLTAIGTLIDFLNRWFRS